MSLLHTAQPLRLYLIERSDTTAWRYANADRAIAWDSHTWEALAISDDGIRLTGEATADEIKITAPAHIPAVQLYRVLPPSAEVFVTVYDYDAATQEAAVCWQGSISAALFPAPGVAELACDSLSASMQREGLRLKYERACPHSVYDHMCGVLKALHAMPVRITALDGVSITVARGDGAAHEVAALEATRVQILDLPDADRYLGGTVAWGGTTRTVTAVDALAGWLQLSGSTLGLAAGSSVTLTAPLPPIGSYDYGAAEWQQDGAAELRGIDSSTGVATVRLLGGTYGLAVGQLITLYPGCDGTRQMCADRFGNLLNHGGFPHMPGESIFGKRLW